ncbi:hypothetical protein IWX89_001546 [Cryobacterium sp. MP_M3]|uniref:hypothetical protein n=1 Tax=unclassified Cryobacterium TaxID=2649013 RepID=UPI0018C9D3ED|nr:MULTISPECIES: hypothetical protein [unclassified Cryobacterium]MBG6058104.1 hypothetical protein [Cryobacterium sp. MP_M3]
MTAGTSRFRSSLVRTLALTASLAIAVLALTFGPAGANAFAAQDFAQCNSVDNTPGLGVTCDVTVTNNLNLDTGAESSTVTTRECHGAANTEPTCTTSTKDFDTTTKSVSQCNYAVNGGGASLICNVTVINNITGQATKAGATVNQCNGSATGGGTALDCTPFPATTTNATITQCNDSAIGGGGSTGVNCRVLPSYQSAELPVAINQCNNSANQGGSVVTCTASLTNNITTAAAITTPTPVATTPVKNVLHDSKTDGFGLAAGHDAGNLGGTAFLGAGVLILLAAGLVAAAAATRKADARR